MAEKQQLASIERIGHRPSHERHRQERYELGDSQGSDRQSRAGDEENLIRNRHDGDLATEVGQELAEVENPKSARLLEWGDIDDEPPTGSGAIAHRRSARVRLLIERLCLTR